MVSLARWFFEGKETTWVNQPSLFGRSQLKIESATSADSGNYTCFIEEKGQILDSVSYSLRVQGEFDTRHHNKLRNKLFSFSASKTTCNKSTQSDIFINNTSLDKWGNRKLTNYILQAQIQSNIWRVGGKIGRLIFHLYLTKTIYFLILDLLQFFFPRYLKQLLLKKYMNRSVFMQKNTL